MAKALNQLVCDPAMVDEHCIHFDFMWAQQSRSQIIGPLRLELYSIMATPPPDLDSALRELPWSTMFVF